MEKIMTLKANPKAEVLFKEEETEEDLKLLQELIKNADLKKLIDLTKILIEAYRHMRYSPFPVIPLKVAVLEFIEEKVKQN